MSAPKVVRTTYYQDMDYDGFPVGTPVVILPASDYDRMVKRERRARDLLDDPAGQAHMFESWRRDVEAFLAEMKGSNDGK